MASSILLVQLAVVSVWIQAQRSRTMVDWARKYQVELAARDLLHSAMEEATHEVLRAINDPSSPLFTRVRGAGRQGSLRDSSVPTTRAMAKAHAGVGAVAARVELLDCHPIVPGLEEESEWEGRLRVTATVDVTEPSPHRLEGVQDREVKATSVSPPRPLDKFGLLIAGVPPERWIPALPVSQVVNR